MKLLVTGATGFVGTEVVRLALRNPSITSVVAIARKPVAAPADPAADATKLTSVVLDDFLKPYPASVQKQIAGANACIWNLSITPSKTKGHEWAEVIRVCNDYVLFGVEQMLAAVGADASRPFRVVFTSGALSERDQAAQLSFMAPHRHMRGLTETKLLELREKHKGALELAITRPGMIDGRFNVALATITNLVAMTGVMAKVHVSEVAGAEIDLAMNGFDADTIENADLVRIGQKVLRKEDYVRL